MQLLPTRGCYVGLWHVRRSSASFMKIMVGLIQRPGILTETVMISSFTGVNRNDIKEAEHSFGEHHPGEFHAKGGFYAILILIWYLNYVSGFCLRMFGF